MKDKQIFNTKLAIGYLYKQMIEKYGAYIEIKYHNLTGLVYKEGILLESWNIVTEYNSHLQRLKRDEVIDNILG